MSTAPSTILNLEQYVHLFRDERSCQEFASVITGVQKAGLRVIVFHDQVIGATLSAEGAKEVLYQRLVKQLSENPDTIEKLAKRLNEDSIVD